MNPKPNFAKDPAGLDELLFAAGKGVTRFVESLVSAKIGRPVILWDGPDGLGAVLREELENAGVSNKRLPELVTPRSILEGSGAIRRKRPIARRVKR